jgi:hypothetical protein
MGQLGFEWSSVMARRKAARWWEMHSVSQYSEYVDSYPELKLGSAILLAQLVAASTQRKPIHIITAKVKDKTHVCNGGKTEFQRERRKGLCQVILLLLRVELVLVRRLRVLTD